MSLGQFPKLTEIRDELVSGYFNLINYISEVGKTGIWDRQSDFAYYSPPVFESVLIIPSGTGIWVAPTGCTQVVFECYGGGGTGGGADVTGKTSGGGAGGQYAKKTLTGTLDNSTFTYSVAPLTAGTYTISSPSGADTYITFNSIDVCRAKGGSGTIGYQTAGLGSLTGGVGDIIRKGGDGADGDGVSWSGAGGGGAGSLGNGGNANYITHAVGAAGADDYGFSGSGGIAVNSLSNGNSGQIAGGGGSGANSAGSSSRSGGAGARGILRIAYLAPEQKIQYASNDTFTVPAGCTQVIFECYGGGGAGGGSDSVNFGGGGGAGGNYAKTIVNSPVVSSIYSIVIGSGGTGVAGANGLPGGSSSVTQGSTICLATGGNSGKLNSAGGVNTGLGIIGSVIKIGGSGADGSTASYSGGGGGCAGSIANGTAGSTYFGGAGGSDFNNFSGNGGNGINSPSGTPTDGNIYGGGGAGEMYTGTPRAGSDGAQGVVLVTCTF